MNDINNVLNNGTDEVVSRAEYDKLLNIIEQLESKVKKLSDEKIWLTELLAHSNKRQYGKRSETSSAEVIEQMTLFDEAETTEYIEQTQKEPVQVAGYKRSPKGQKKSNILDNIPEGIETETVEHTIPEDQRICEYCGSVMEPIGKKSVKTIKIVPARVVVVIHDYITYTCKECNGDDEQADIIETPHEPSCYPGSYTSPEAVAYIMYEKFVMGAPLYRLELDFRRKQVLLSRQTMSNWILHCSRVWLKPIYEVLHRQLVQHDIINADETTLQVLHEPGKTPESKSYMWLYRTGAYARNPILLYEYQPGRRGEHPVKFLKGFNGYLQTDGYSGYNGVPDVIHVGCLAHLRRKFHDAVLVLPKDSKKGSAVEGEAYCNRLFKIEESLSGLTAEERYEQRLKLEKPILDEFLAWGKTRTASEKSSLGVALTYLRNQGPVIANYLLDGRLEISNNICERSIKIFVTYRKGFLFANTPNGAEGSAVMFSLIETAKESGLDPFKYLTYVFRTAPVISRNNQDWASVLTPAEVKPLIE